MAKANGVVFWEDEMRCEEKSRGLFRVNLPAADNLITSIGSFTRNGQTQLAADINLTVNFALTDSNPNRPLDQAPTLAADIFDLPWLRGYGLVNVISQKNPFSKLAFVDLVAQSGSVIGAANHSEWRSAA